MTDITVRDAIAEFLRDKGYDALTAMDTASRYILEFLENGKDTQSFDGGTIILRRKKENSTK